MPLDIKILLLGLTVFLINIPFGYWRANTKSRSIEWLATIHIPVIIIIFIRFQFDIDFTIISVLTNIFSFISGQYIGMKLFVLMRRTGINGTSCLIIDLKEYFLNNK
jgi:hypothetical protein